MSGINYVTFVEAGAATLAVIGSIKYVPKAARWVMTVARKVNQFGNDWFGEEARPGVDARPGVLENIQSTNAEARAGRKEAAAARQEAVAAREAAAAVSAAMIAMEKRTAAVMADFDVRLGETQDLLAETAEKVADTANKVTEVHHETQPNGGWSMKDQLNRIDPASPTIPPKTPLPPTYSPEERS